MNRGHRRNRVQRRRGERDDADLQGIGFEGPFMMDHTPTIADDPEGRAGHAFATGYMRVMLRAVFRRPHPSIQDWYRHG